MSSMEPQVHPNGLVYFEFIDDTPSEPSSPSSPRIDWITPRAYPMGIVIKPIELPFVVPRDGFYAFHGIADQHAETLRLQHEAEPAPTVPIPTGSLHSWRTGMVRFYCPLECGWFHDENPGAELPRPIVCRTDLSDLSEALSAAAQASGLATARRVEQAFADHLAVDHPEH